MKKNIFYTLLYIFIGLILFSCQEDDEYTLKDYNPKGGLTQDDFTIESEQYLKSTKEDVEVVFNFNRLNAKTLNFSIELSEVSPVSYSNAFTLTTTSASLTENTDTLVIGQIDWSVLDCDSSVFVTIRVIESETIETGTNTETLTIKFHKEAKPVIDLGIIKLEKYFDFNATENISTTIEIINAIDKPAEQEIRMPLQNLFQLTEGTQFDIQQELVIPIGSTDASINLDVYIDEFVTNERGLVRVEAHQDDVPDNISAIVGSDYWIGANIGKVGEILKLYNARTYAADVFFTPDLDPSIPFTITMQVSDVPVLQDLKIPINLNEYYVQEGVHFLMPEKFITIKAGDSTGTIEFDMLPEGFDIGVTLPLYVELDKSYTENPQVSFDDTDWWSKLNFTKQGEVYTVTLDQLASYDALISDVSTTVDVDVVIPNLLDKAAPSDLNIPVQFNEYHLQMDTHFTSDGIIRVSSGETSGTITISVIGSAFTSGASNSLWIEVYNDDMPVDPILVTNSSNWWTTLNVGKQ